MNEIDPAHIFLDAGYLKVIISPKLGITGY